jgi:hypothetical protein
LIGDAAHLAVPFTSAGTTIFLTLKLWPKPWWILPRLNKLLIPIIKTLQRPPII